MNCPICDGSMEDIQVAPCFDCGHAPSELEDLRNGAHRYFRYRIWDEEIVLCDYCDADMGSYFPDYFGLPEGPVLMQVPLECIAEVESPQAIQEPWCSTCKHRHAFLQFLAAARVHNRRDTLAGRGWKETLPQSVELGGASAEELRQWLRTYFIQLNRGAEELLADPRLSVSAEKGEASIVAASVDSLGFPEGACFPQIVAAAKARGLSLCPLELAVWLRLQWKGQPVAPERPSDAEPGSPPGAITVASAPLDASDETPRGFYLRNIDGTLWLRGYWADDQHLWAPNDLFVFARNDS